MIYKMGLERHLYGVTFECDSDKPRVVRSYLEGNNYSSNEIDRVVSESKANGEGLYYIDIDLLNEISPDIIFTQDVCDVCQIDTSYVQRAITKLKKQPLIIPLIPSNLEDVFENILTIAKTLEDEKAGIDLLVSLQKGPIAFLTCLEKITHRYVG
jgi:iron complex transport system substrate-binding protein